MVYDNALGAAKKGALTHDMASDLGSLMNIVIENARVTVFEMNGLVYSLESGAGKRR